MEPVILFLQLILLDTQFNDVCPCMQTDVQLDLTSQYQTATFIPAFLWQMSWVYPIEGLVIGLFIVLMIRYRIMYNTKLFSHEKLGIVQNIAHKTQTPLTLMHHLLEEIASDNLPEPTSQKLKRVLGYTSHIMNSYQNIGIFSNIENEIYPGSPIEFELYTFITSITNQCQSYANTRQIQLNVSKDFGYISCRVDEITMTAALQCLLSKIIDATPCKGCINMNVSHLNNHWSLRITNGPECKQDNKKLLSLLSALMLIYHCGNLQIIKKIIRLHGGKLIGDCHRRIITFQVIVPINGCCNTIQCPEVEIPTIKDGKMGRSDKNRSHVLLVMSDNELSSYLNEALSTLFRITILNNPERLSNFSGQRTPDIIIIDEIVNGIGGKEIYSRIKSNASMVQTPAILLMNFNDNRSYLTHIHCGVDKLAPRAISICRLKADIQVLINKHKRIKQLLETNLPSDLPETTSKSEENTLFMDKVNKLLEKNLSSDNYTVDMLSADMGMCRTTFYTKLKEITDKAPAEYMYYFKMNKAKILLVTQKYTVTEIATYLGFCDAKYFGARFKKFYKVPPTRYIKEIL